MKLALFTLDGPTAQLPDGPDGRVVSTVAAMRALATVGAFDARVFQAARLLLNSDDVASGRVSYPDAVYWYCRARVEFERDPLGVELLKAPGDLIAQAAASGGRARGDCDDRSMLAAALLGAGGFRSSFVVMSPAERGPYRHVFYALGWPTRSEFAPDGLTPYDPQERFPPGVWPAPLPRGGRMRAFPVV